MYHNLMILKAEIKRQIILFKRYPFEPISSLFVVAIGFIAIFFSTNISNGNNFENIGELFLRYLLGTLSMMLISDMGISIANEAKLGTLERIYSMPSRLFKVITIRNIVSIIFVLIQLSIFIFIFLLFFNSYLTRYLTGTTFLALLLYVISMAGVGYTLSGLTLLYKNIGSVSQLIQFIFLFIALIPYNFLHDTLRYIIGLIPGAMAVQIINNSHSGFEIFLGTVFSMSHLIIGILLFKIMEKRILIHGSLGRY